MLQALRRGGLVIARRPLGARALADQAGGGGCGHDHGDGSSCGHNHGHDHGHGHAHAHAHLHAQPHVHTHSGDCCDEDKTKRHFNRNPRSDEVMGIAPVRTGFGTTPKTLGYVNKLTLHFSNMNTTAHVSRADGDIICSASTLEYGIEKQLYSGSDKSAARAVGRVLAQRLVESGITRVLWDRTHKRYHGKVKEFVDAVQAGGVSFKESVAP